MPEPAYVHSKKVTVYQSDITAEANTDAGATWGAAESTLANSLKGKINSILAALRSAGVLGGSGNKFVYVNSLKGRRFLTDIANEATADSDATYGQPEADLLTSMKGKVNGILAALRSAQIVGGRERFIYVNGRRKKSPQADIASISIADADGTYTSGGAGEQGLTNDIKAKVNLIITAMDDVGITV